MQPTWLRNAPADWGADTLDRDAFYAAATAMQQHPGFDVASREFAANMVDAFARDAALRRLLRTEASLAFCACVLMLHHRRDPAEPATGASYSRLVELLAVGPVGSRTLVKQELAINRLRGHLQPAAASGRGRRIVEPTPRLLRALGTWLAANLRAVERVAPLPDRGDQLGRDPALIAEVLTCGALAYARGGFILSERFPEVRTFMAREQGYVLLMAIIESCRPMPGPDGTTRHVARVPLQSLAQRLGVARGTLRNLLTLALRRRWLLRVGRGGHEIELAPEFAGRCTAWMALELVWMAGIAGAAAAATAAAR